MFNQPMAPFALGSGCHEQDTEVKRCEFKIFPNLLDDKTLFYIKCKVQLFFDQYAFFLKDKLKKEFYFCTFINFKLFLT